MSNPLPGRSQRLYIIRNTNRKVQGFVSMELLLRFLFKWVKQEREESHHMFWGLFTPPVCDNWVWRRITGREQKD